ncbi:MAG: SGNH/GDSL hydrolase family protein [Rhodospirillales bacterium]|nr:SGNH/GDSL hydrolase family protein [Acetobacter sp.]
MGLGSFRALASTLAAVFLLSPEGHTQTGWVGTWAAAPSATPYRDGALPGTRTLREIVHVSRGGTQVRVTLSNELGVDSLTVSGAHLGTRAQGSAVAPGSDHALTFGGEATVVIPPGAVAVSDGLPVNVAALSDLAITLLLPAQPLHMLTEHALGLQTSFEADGDQLAKADLTGSRTFEQWRFLKNVEVNSGPHAAAIVTLGDSITDGYKSTANTNRRWPDVLAGRLQADRKLSGVAVLNEGISGNRVLHDGAGPNALARFDRDVLSQSGVRYLILLEAINDIGRTAQPGNPVDPVTTEQLLVGYQQIIERAHAHGIRVYGATLTPFMGAGYATPAGETMRQEVNRWIRTTGHFDGVIDFDKVTRDSDHPGVFSPAADSGDHLHPGDAGYRQMGDAIDLKLFQP